MGGSPTKKADVLDGQGRTHSVKAGIWSQIFLYRRDRLITDTFLLGIGDLADTMVACLDAFPHTREGYLADKNMAKLKLQEPMRRLQVELSEPNRLSAFLEWAIFDGGNVDYFSITPGPANRSRDTKIFHIFDKGDVVSALADDIEVRNSKARNSRETNDQKVTFKTGLYRRNIGELEERHDGTSHYREMKFRLNTKDVYGVLEAAIPRRDEVSGQLIVYGNAITRFRPSV